MSLQAAPTQSAMSQRKRSKLIEDALVDIAEDQENRKDDQC